MEIELFSCIAKINRDLLLYHLSLENKDIIFSSRSQGKLDEHPTAPLIFTWYFKWKKEQVIHEITFGIWKDINWELKSEHNTDDIYNFGNRFNGEFLYNYSFDNVKDMMDAFEKVKKEFLTNFERIFNL